MRQRAGATPITHLLSFDTVATALGARLTTAICAVNQLSGRDDMHDHQATLGGVRTTLRFLCKELPITQAAYYDLCAVTTDLRNLWSPTRGGRGGEPNQTANLLCIADQQLQGAARLIADALKEGR